MNAKNERTPWGHVRAYMYRITGGEKVVCAIETIATFRPP